MRLYLSSYRLGDHPEDLVRLMRGNGRVLVVCNAVDNAPAEVRQMVLDRELGDMRGLGFQASELDLRNWFDRQADVANELEDADAVWMSGGNAFLLRRALRQSGFDEALADRVRNNDVVLSGYSAGAIMATPTLRGLDLVDDPHGIASGYAPEIVEECLGLVNFSFAPHYRSDHPESEAIEQVVAYFEEHEMPYRAVRDGEALVIDE